MKRTLVFLLFVIIHSVCAQEISVSANKLNSTGAESLKHLWKSTWINDSSTSSLEYGVYLFRKQLQLSNVPPKLILYVSADNRYKLFVNGQFMCSGPARGDQLHWSYETVDIAPALRTGRNIISCEVVNFGLDKPVAQHSFKTGLLVQAADSMYDDVNTRAGSWKVFHNEAYQPIHVTFAMVNGYYAAGPCDSVNGSRYPWAWKDAAFNDAPWAYAAASNLAVGRGYIYGNAIHLVPRTIPAMERKPERFQGIVRTDYSLAKSIGFIKGQPTIIPAHSRVHFLLDMEYLTTGYPQFSFSAGAGCMVKTTYAEALVDGSGKKGNRNDIANKHIEGYYDVYRPDGGTGRVLEPLWQRTFRYVQFDIETTNQELVINDFYNYYTAYPFVQRAHFHCDDLHLTKIWNVAWRTARLCAGETYFDCPYYEQLQYVGDTRIQGLISLYVSGDDRLLRNALQLFDQSRISDGLTLSRYPSNLPQIIPPYSLVWINMVHDYYLYRGDSLFLRQFEQGIKDVLFWFESKTDSSGMLNNLEWWNYTDETKGFDMGISRASDRGHSALSTLQYVYALQHATELMMYFKDTAAAEKYSRQAAAAQRMVLEKCYDPNRGLIAEDDARQEFSVHTTLLAILTNTIRPSEQKKVLLKSLEDKTLIQPSIYFRFYLFRCLQQVESGDDYLSHLKPWEAMLTDGLTTFAESDSNTRSDCHAWSASPLFDFLHLVAGIQPGSPGFRTIVIAPNIGPLQSIDATFPHPLGKVTVHLVKKRGQEISGYVELPNGLSGVFRFHSREIKLTGGNRQLIDL